MFFIDIHRLAHKSTNVRCILGTMDENEVVSASDLFGRMRIIKKEGKVESERASLIRYFTTVMEKAPQVVGVRLAHYSLKDLYYLQSDHKDRARRDALAAKKWLWVITRTKTS